MRLRSTTSNVALVEIVRLVVVVLTTAAAFRLAGAFFPAYELLAVLLGASIGYVIGGVIGRFTLGRIDAAERNLRAVPAQNLLAGAMGGLVGLVIGTAIVWPV